MEILHRGNVTRIETRDRRSRFNRGVNVVESENESFIILHPLHRSSWDIFSPVEERFVFKIQSFVDHFSVARISLSLSFLCVSNSRMQYSIKIYTGA